MIPEQQPAPWLNQDNLRDTSPQTVHGLRRRGIKTSTGGPSYRWGVTQYRYFHQKTTGMSRIPGVSRPSMTNS